MTQTEAVRSPSTARGATRSRRGLFAGRGLAGNGKSLAASVLPPVVVLVALIALWQILVDSMHVDPSVLPSPSRIYTSGKADFSTIMTNALATVQVTLAGFALSLVVAWILAVAIDFSKALRRGFMPLLVASQTIPIIAIAPLMIIWFGFGMMPKMLVVALTTFFPIVVGLVEGFDRTDRETANLLRSMGAGRWRQFVSVRLPSALPAFFTALRISITYAVVGAIFAEYVGAEKGLGIFMSAEKNAYRTDLVLAAVVVSAIISIVLYLLTFTVERLVIPWSFKERRVRSTD